MSQIPGLRAPSPLDQLPAASPRKGTDIAQAAHEFEGMLLSQMMQVMRSTVEPSGLFGEGGQARSTYEYLLDQAVIDKAVKAGRGFGLAERLERLWNKRQETSHALGLGKSGQVPIG